MLTALRLLAQRRRQDYLPTLYNLLLWARNCSAHSLASISVSLTGISPAIGSIYPTSDHWHQAVTPAMTLMALWLGMTAPNAGSNRRKGAFLVALCVKFQTLSRRVVPEALRFTLRALSLKNKTNANETKAHVANLMAMVDLWKEKTAFIEMFSPALPLLKKSSTFKTEQKILIILLS